MLKMEPIRLSVGLGRSWGGKTESRVIIKMFSFKQEGIGSGAIY